MAVEALAMAKGCCCRPVADIRVVEFNLSIGRGGGRETDTGKGDPPEDELRREDEVVGILLAPLLCLLGRYH